MIPTNATSEDGVVCSAQRVVVERARAPRDAAVQQHCLEYLGSEHPDFELEGSARSVIQSRVYFRKLHHALRMRRLTSMYRSALWLTFPSRYTNSFVGLCTWSAASTLNEAVGSGNPFLRKHMISVLASDPVRPNAVHTHDHDHDHPHYLLQLFGGLRGDASIVSVKHALKQRRQDLVSMASFNVF